MPKRICLISVSALALSVTGLMASAQAATQTFSYNGAEQTFTVPAGVTSVNVFAIGGSGGAGNGGGAGGAAGAVSANLTVVPGQVLYVEVGGSGQGGGAGSAGGFNGGGGGGAVIGGGGGGGASDVRSSPRSNGLAPDPRLVVAPGGGGGGATSSFSSGGAGGAAETVGSKDSTGGNAGGGAGTASMGGAGGSGNPSDCYVGTGGQRGLGGAGGGGSSPSGAGGGGGGGGSYGGGGGETGCSYGGAGGGGGSFLVPAGGSKFLALAQSPQIQISYTPASGEGGTGPTPAPVPGAAVRATISGLSQTHPVFRASAKSTPLLGSTTRSSPRGTTFSFRLDQPATVTVRIERKLSGRRVGRVCNRSTSQLRQRPRCTRLVTNATLRRSARVGLNRIAFSGRVRGRALPAGRYRAALTAANTAGTSSPRALGLRIVAP